MDGWDFLLALFTKVEPFKASELKETDEDNHWHLKLTFDPERVEFPDGEGELDINVFWDPGRMVVNFWVNTPLPTEIQRTLAEPVANMLNLRSGALGRSAIPTGEPLLLVNAFAIKVIPFGPELADRLYQMWRDQLEYFITEVPQSYHTFMALIRM